MLIEKEEIVFRDEKRKIYYLDETWAFLDGLSAGLKNPAGSEDGFVPEALWAFESKKTGDYHEEMDGNSFENWFSKMLLKLENNAVIVLDNAPIVNRHKYKYDFKMIDEMAKKQNKTHYKNGAKIKNTFRALPEHFGRNNRPNETTIGRLVRKFEATGSVANLLGSGRPRSVRTPENIAVVKESVRDDPKQSTTRRSQELGISRTSLLRILHTDLNVHAYKIQLTQELRRADHFSRRTFSDWLLQIDENFSSKIMFSDEAHFTLNGTVNKQNCRIWANENPREYREQPMHPQKVTVWSALWSKGIIGPYFFENAAGDAVTVNSERYHVMIEDYFLPQLEGMDMDDVYFQQDGPTCHTTNVNIHRLQSFFGDRVISRRGNVPWPPRSCDLTPLDLFLWGYLKSKVYVNKPATLQELKNNIIAEINAIEPTMLQNVIENFDHRVDVCKSSRVIIELRKINPERRIILHQDNAPAHTAQKTMQYLTEENVELLNHPPYSPDLSPNDFFTFPKIKNRLRGQRFQSPEEAVDAFENACFENWFERMQMCINLHGEYFEKQ
ncbi:unnamed protein product [Acanthoscelides obtectus]|uniref:Transposase n=1 Tax=Acanthoscelides obtectus TaxID=200917 RepID=A0A9P0JVD4_ACAOB|nr:unnamed protein product [Acanthoscelides obtectus]CAK1653081.1 Histone-lysine N-methyltransferase SETMAR [Acanthoscelides obtectus]